MILGAHSFIFTEYWTDDSLPILDEIRELGGGMVEIPVGDDMQFTPRLTRQHAERLGLELSIGPGLLWPLECDISSDDPDERQMGLAWHKRQADVASELGAVAYTGALYGHPGVVKRRVPPAAEYERIAESLNALAEYASRRGVLIALEPMSHFRTHVANTPEQIMRLIGMAGHTNLHVVLDTYHLVTEVRDFAEAIRTASDRLWGLHACESDRGLPGGGLVPWEAVFSAVREIQFDGYLLLETYNSSLGDFAFRRGMFHNVCPDGTAFVREGFRFLKAGLAAAGIERGFPRP